MSMRGMNFGGWLLMETWIPSIEMEWHDHLPRLAEEAGVLEELKKSLKIIGEFMPDEDDSGAFSPMAETHQSYIARLNTELQKHAPAEKYAAYMELFEREPSVFAAKQMDAILRQRFGDVGAQRLWDAFHDTWITERDFQLARAHGFNFIRIPFWYRWFETDDAPYRYHEYGFSYLAKAVAWAEKHGLYVMLDFHGAVGGQSPWDHTGTLSEIEFFRNKEYQKRTAALWREIARRYKDNPVVWAYDLLNEPFSATDTDNWAEAHDLLYDAIREVDPDKIVVMEDGYKLEFPRWTKKGFFPSPRKMGWENLIYSIHFYSGADPLFSDEKGLADHDKRSQEVLRLARLVQDRHDVPIYFGEFSTMGDHPNDIEGMRTFLTMFNRHGFHWSPWTWKYVDDDNEGTIWGLYQYAKEWPVTPNIHRDSLESLLKVVARYTMDDFVLMQPYGNVLNECLAQPVRAASPDAKVAAAEPVPLATESFRVEYVHYRPAKWETEQVVEIERELPNRGGLVYLYVKNTSAADRRIRYWQYQGKDRTHWLQGNLIAWDRTLATHLKPGAMTVIEINGISTDFQAGTDFRFSLVDGTWEPAMRYSGRLQADSVNVSYLRVLPSMDRLEVHLRHEGNGAVEFTDIALEGASVADVTWRGQSVSGPGHAIARVRLAEPVQPSTLLLLKVTLRENGETRSLYAHRRAYADKFPVGTWGMDKENYEFLADSHIDTGVKGGRRGDEFFGGASQQYGLRSLVDVGHWPENVERLKSLSGHPAVFAWMLRDEPDWSSHSQEILSLADAVKAIDSTKPIFVTLCRNVKFMEFAPIVDVPCMDHYCVTAPTAAVWEHEYGGRLEETGYYTRDLKYASEPKPTVVWSQGIHHWTQRPKRGTPTSEELSVQLVQNLGRGAKGILWFTWKKQVAEEYPSLLKTAVDWNRIMHVLKEDLMSSEPARLRTAAPEKVDVATLLAWDKVILCVSNLDYQIRDDAYAFADKRDVEIEVKLPAWITPRAALRMRGDGVSPTKFSLEKNKATLTVGDLHDASIFVLANDNDAQGTYESAYDGLQKKEAQLRRAREGSQ